MAIDQQIFEEVRRIVRDDAAIVLDDGKEYLVETRLTTLSRQLGIATIAELAQRLVKEGDQILRRQVVEALTTNETSFFRDIGLFNALRTTLIPELIAKRKSQRRLSIWCAACSTGQEPYSLGMLLLDSFPQLAGWETKIFATDINSKVLETAKNGRYSQFEVNRGLPAPNLVKYFKKCGSEWVISANLQSLITFQEFNLVKPWPAIGPFDLVLLRNVLIYFDMETKRQVLGNVKRVLERDGYLFLGASETTLNIDDDFKRTSLDKISCYSMA